METPKEIYVRKNGITILDPDCATCKVEMDDIKYLRADLVVEKEKLISELKTAWDKLGMSPFNFNDVFKHFFEKLETL